MKLRLHPNFPAANMAYVTDPESPVGHRIVTKPMEPDQFCYHPHQAQGEPQEMRLPCRGGKYESCIVRITRGPAVHPVWHWDGNIEAPTLTPSIGCDQRCGWHGTLTAGELLP